MIEFKRAGDVMVFECPAFKIEVLADSERIELNRDAISIQNDALGRISDAFEILDMMIELKNKQSNTLKLGPDIAFDVKRDNPGKVVSEMHVKVNVDTTDAEKAIDKLNNYVWGSKYF